MFTRFFISLFSVSLLVFSAISGESDSTSVSQTALPRFSMGFFLTPYYSQKTIEPTLEDYCYPFWYTDIPQPNWNYYYNFEPAEESLFFASGNLEFRVWNKLYLQGSLHIVNRSTQVTREKIINPISQDTTYVSKRSFTSDITLIIPQIGIKFYFKSQEPKRVSPYTMAGIGKQYPIIKFNFEKSNANSNERRNLKDFFKSINTATVFYFGAGSEYLFSTSLGLFTQVMWEFSSQQGKYTYQYKSTAEEQSTSDEWQLKAIRTFWSIGVRMYF